MSICYVCCICALCGMVVALSQLLESNPNPVNVVEPRGRRIRPSARLAVCSLATIQLPCSLMRNTDGRRTIGNRPTFLPQPNLSNIIFPFSQMQFAVRADQHGPCCYPTETPFLFVSLFLNLGPSSLLCPRPQSRLNTGRTKRTRVGVLHNSRIARIA